jgi:Domain of unknown function (DUF4296)
MSIIQSLNHLSNLSIILSLFLLFLFGCKNNEVIEQDKMVLIYTDLMIAQDTSVVNDKNLDSLRTTIFNRHNIAESDYEKTIGYYNEELERWEDFFDKVTSHIENLKKKAG